MERVRLLIDVDAEDVHIPAGTICWVEKFYPPDDNGFACYDLVIGETEEDALKHGVIFWVNAHEAKPL